MEKAFTILKRILVVLVQVGVSAVCLLLTVAVLWNFVLGSGESGSTAERDATSYAVMNRYDTYVTNTRSDALAGVLSIKKVYWLSDDDLVAPEPDQSKFGETDDPSTLQWLLEDAGELLEGQDTLFDPKVRIFEGSTVNYYLDETILAITWKQVIADTVYTISEVKIADPSQFRRFLSDGVYASGSKYVGTDLASSVNAVVASSGDYYAFRNMGIIVYDSRLMRPEGVLMDSCLIDRDGNLRFLHRGEMTDPAEMERFVEDNGIRFSLAFGPILVENGEIAEIPSVYPVGEGDVSNPRAALCQLDELHYLLVMVSAEPPYDHGHTLDEFAAVLRSFGCDKAYNLDGGGTATLVMNDKLMNFVFQRMISDIIYFATAVPNGE